MPKKIRALVMQAGRKETGIMLVGLKYVELYLYHT
jgi:hypothetical protein